MDYTFKGHLWKLKFIGDLFSEILLNLNVLTGLVADVFIHSARLSRKAAFSLTARLPEKEEASVSCTLASLSFGWTGVADEVAETGAVGLSWLVGVRPRPHQGGCWGAVCWVEERWGCARHCAALPRAKWAEVSVCVVERKAAWVVQGCVCAGGWDRHCEAVVFGCDWDSLVCFSVCVSLEVFVRTLDVVVVVFCCTDVGGALTVCVWTLLCTAAAFTRSAGGWFVKFTCTVALCCTFTVCVCVSAWFIGCTCACGRATVCTPVKSLGNRLVKSCCRLLVFSIARLIQDTSGEAAWGPGWGSWGTVGALSASLGSEEVACTAAGVAWASPVDGRWFLAGRERPEGVGSKKAHKSVRHAWQHS